MKQMKIALVIEYLDETRGGAETSTAQFARHLGAMGCRVTVFTRSSPANTTGVDCRLVPAASWFRYRRTLKFSRAVDAMLVDHDFDLVHAITPCMTADVYEPRGGTVPETVARNLALQPPGFRRALKQFANRFNLKQQSMLKLERRLLTRNPPPVVIALSDYVCRQLRDHYNLDSSCIRKIFNGVDAAEVSAAQHDEYRRRIRDQFGIADSDVVALLVGHNFKLKGVAPWITALHRIVEGQSIPIHTLIAGKSNPRPYHRLARRLGVADRVHFAGPVSPIEPFYHAADVLVHPTYYDPCSRTVLEAMLHGLPCVTTRFNGAAEIIENGVTGRILDTPDDIKSLAESVVDLLQPHYRANLQNRRPQLVRQLSMKRHAEEVFHLYQELLSGCARTK